MSLDPTALPAGSPLPRQPLPPDDGLRAELHNEVHARPLPSVALPALVRFVAVLNEGVTREHEWSHLCRLAGQQQLSQEALQGSYLRLVLDGCTLKWERHTEYTRYTIVQPLPAGAGLGACDPSLPLAPCVSSQWLATLPGRTVAAIELAMVHGEPDDASALVPQAQRWLGSAALVGSRMGRGARGPGHSCAFTDFQLRPSGYERWLVVAPPDTSATRAGRSRRPAGHWASR